MSHELHQSPSPSSISLHQHQLSGSNSPQTPLDQSSGMKSGKVKRMACVECRQQKSRCDAYEKQPNPCSRCAKKGLKCDIKSDYKRTYKRARIAQIEKEFQELKKSLTNNQAAELVSKYPSLSTAEQLEQKIRAESLANNTPGVVNYNSQHIQQPMTSTNIRVSSPYNNMISHNSSESNPSIPNTPSISVPFVSNYNNNNNNLTTTTRGTTASPRTSGVPIPQIPEEVLYCEEKAIDSIKLSPETIRNLYVEYVERYHPILPVVDISKGPERIFRLCPPLFWVIMFVSLRRFEEDSSKSLLLELSPIVKGVLAEIMISPITRYNPTEEDEPILNVSSVYSAQAFLLYSYWPPITSSLSADSSYHTVSTAFFQAIRIGLHSPTSIDLTGKQKTPQQLAMVHEQIKTWIMCNVASQTIATAFGFPACTQFDSSIWFYNQPSSDVKIRRDLLLMMEIAQFEDQMSKSLNSNPMDPCGLIDASERLPLLKLLCKRLDALEMTLRNESFAGNGKDFRMIAQFELQKGLIKLYNAAMALINHTRECQAKDKKFIKYLPGVYLLNLWQAGCIIGKLIHSSLKKFIDTGSGKQSYEAVIHLTAKASILKHDMAYRSSGITRNMWQLFRTLDAKKMNFLSIEIRNRMSASVFFDCLNLLRTQVGITKLSMKTDENNVIDDEDDEVIENSQEDDEEEEADQGKLRGDEVEDGGANGTSSKSTPLSNASSRTKKARTLSNNEDAESKARKIIRTIPLDPEPISIGGSKRSSIFKVVNSSADSSPKELTGQNKTNVTERKLFPVPTSYPSQQQQQQQHTPVPPTPQQQQRYQPSHTLPSQQYDPQQFAKPATEHPMPQFPTLSFNDSPIQLGLENLDMDSFDHDMLWKDVDDVMNDFGFHAT
ncbi:LEU3 Regulatory protein LEU3 [Candida maltosa Xu316]